jgi:hypothetical protein
MSGSPANPPQAIASIFYRREDLAGNGRGYDSVKAIKTSFSDLLIFHYLIYVQILSFWIDKKNRSRANCGCRI